MTCKEFRDTTLLEATTSGKPGSGAVTHLKDCNACGAWVADQRKRSDRWELFAQKLAPAQAEPEGRLARLMKLIGL